MGSLTSRSIAVCALLLGMVAAATPGALGQDAPAETIEVSGVEYAFVGLPSSVPVGTSFRLRNDGKEDHEFFVVRRNEGTTEPVEELLALPQPELFSKLTLIGGVAAQTGATSPATLTLEEEGEYIVVCFIQQGTSGGVSPSPEEGAAASPGAAPSPGAPAGGPPGGLPHAFLGMTAEFTVGGPDTPLGPLSTPIAEGNGGGTPEASPAG